MKTQAVQGPPGTLKRIASTFKAELRYYRLLWADPRTPRFSKWMLRLALAYLALPFDLIPDAIPVLGHLDDALIIPLLLYLGLRGIPQAVKVNCRREAQVSQGVGVERRRG